MNQPEAAFSRESRLRKSIALNSVWNFAGQISPLILAVFAIPVLVRHLGVDRYGVLTLAWILVGYFSLFDFGMGRAITKLLAEKIALHDSESAAGLIWTALVCMMLLGFSFCAVLWVLGPWLTHSLLKIPAGLQQETLRCIPWLAASIPFVTLTSGLRGILEAQQNFAAVNFLRAGLGFFGYLGPLAVVLFSRSLFLVIVTLALTRIGGCGLHVWACGHFVPFFSGPVRWRRESFRSLVALGSWMTVSNIITPLLIYLDRFIVGALISVSAIAFYGVPFDAVTKLWMIPAALAGVLFPAFSETMALENYSRVKSLYERSIITTFSILFPIALATVLFAHEGLQLWLGSDFSIRSSGLLQIFTIGVFTNSLANMPYAFLQASGRPDLTAKVHLVEAPCYIAVLLWAIRAHGLEGAALTWTVSLTIEAAVLFFLTRNLLAPRLWIAMTVGTATLVIACVITGVVPKLLLFTVLLAFFGCVVWRHLLDDPSRSRLQSWLKAIPLHARVHA
jgi:O-antigen/teichoic acid export membrane protein